MLHMMKVRIPIEAGNMALRDREFVKKMNDYLAGVKAKAAYFSTVEGQRGRHIVLDMAGAADMPGIAKPLFFWLDADVSCEPVMAPEDLAKAGPGIAAAVQKWG